MKIPTKIKLSSMFNLLRYLIMKIKIISVTLFCIVTNGVSASESQPPVMSANEIWFYDATAQHQKIAYYMGYAQMININQHQYALFKNMTNAKFESRVLENFIDTRFKGLLCESASQSLRLSSLLATNKVSHFLTRPASTFSQNITYCIFYDDNNLKLDSGYGSSMCDK